MKGAGKIAIVLGATGLTGGLLLGDLLKDARYSKVKLISRKPGGVSHPKIEEHLGDLFQLEQFKDHFYADEVFCCIGTTRAKTPDKVQYKRIDCGIPVAAAALARENGIKTFLVISSMGADPKSRLFYNRTKGEMEQAVLSYKLPRTFILRPSLISGKRSERRVGEWIARQLMGIFNIFLAGPLGKYRSIHPRTIARAMIWLANNSWEKEVVPSDEIRRIAERN